MFESFNPSLLDSLDFKEDSVREILISPILTRLGYTPSGTHRVARSKTLKHPFIFIGTRKHPVTIVPDYTLYNADEPILILDAKRPTEDLADPSHIQQAYSYAIHPEVRCKHFALCNGKRLVVYSIDQKDPLLDLAYEHFETHWPLIEKHLAPRFLLMPSLRKFAPDFGFRLIQIGLEAGSKITFIGARLGTFGRVSDDLYTAGTNCELGNETLFASFDFHPDLLPKMVSGLPEPLKNAFVAALSRAPFMAAGDLMIEVDVTVEIGPECCGEYETFVPLIVRDVMGARFNPSEVKGDPNDIPPHVFRLKKAVVIVPPK